MKTAIMPAVQLLYHRAEFSELFPGKCTRHLIFQIAELQVLFYVHLLSLMFARGYSELLLSPSSPLQQSPILVFVALLSLYLLPLFTPTAYINRVVNH